jgi:ketosteroid isomerase-like protein
VRLRDLEHEVFCCLHLIDVQCLGGFQILKNWSFFLAFLALSLVGPDSRADAPLEPRTEVAAALKGMGDAANAHDVERHVGYYARIPNVTLIVDGEPLVGWNTIRDRQQEWWNNGKTDVVYQLQGTPEILELDPNLMVTTLLMKAHRTLSSGEVKEGRIAVSSIWQKGPDGWKVVYSHESSTH